MKFSLEGVSEALSNLRKVEEAVAEPKLQDDGLEAVEPIAKDAQSLAPVDEGDLRDSIKAKIFEDGTVGVEIGDWKGHFFEFGTVKMRATPMLIPAFDRNESLVLEMFSGRVGARIEGAV